MSDTTYIEAGDADFLGKIEGFNDLPSKCLFNKVLTGSGGTSVALRSDKPYVLTMPYRELIANKVKWCEQEGIDVVPIYYRSGFTTKDIPGAKKILTTYDSLHRVVEALGDSIKDYKLLVDEFHLLTKSGDFRYDAVNSVLKLYERFGDFVFMTATPMRREYLPSAIEHLPEVRVRWNNLQVVTINYAKVEQKELYPTVANIAIKHFTGELQGNAYIFLNSVEPIVEVMSFLTRNGISRSDLRIICADKDRNRELIEENLGKDFSIGNTFDDPKKINFLTSKAFEGCDIFDPKGRSYIIVDGQRNHTKLDITSSIPQIIGRIRDAEIKNYVDLIYSPSPYFSYTTEAEFRAICEQRLNQARDAVKVYNESTNPLVKYPLLKSAEEDKYLIRNGNSIEVCETALKAEMSSFHAVQILYYGRNERPKTREVTINEVPYKLEKADPSEHIPEDIDVREFGLEKMSFKDMCDFLNQVCEDNGVNPFNTSYGLLPESVQRKLNIIGEYHPIIPESFEKLGFQKIKALKYNQRLIKGHILKINAWSDPLKVMNLLDKEDYAIGKKRSLENIKADLQDIYDELGIEATAKASDIEELFDVKPTKVTVNGLRVNGYTFLAHKIRIKQDYEESNEQTQAAS